MISNGYSNERKQIFYANSYQDKTLTHGDIATIFSQKVLSYLSGASYYVCDWEIQSAYKDQNYGWMIEVIKDAKKELVVYEIWFYFSNGKFVAKFANNSFSSTAFKNTFDAKPVNAATLSYITAELDECRVLAEDTWIKNGYTPDGILPMNFYSFD